MTRFTAAGEDAREFPFFKRAEADFAVSKSKGRQLHVRIVCHQVCDHHVKKVLEAAERIAQRKLSDWFISACIGYSPKVNAQAWLEYRLTFEGKSKA